MNKKYILVVASLLALGLVLFAVLFPYDSDFSVLSPKGMIGMKERDLIIIASGLMLLVGIPVVIATFIFAWKYRASNKKAKYDPNWDYSMLAESIWWGVPCVIIAALSVICWKSTHELDPFKPIVTGTKPLRIQAIALQWKWLFIYPEERIATVNYIQFPKDTPLNFEITADAPMNSFWIPQLGGQIYAMPGMKTKLHLIANEYGTFRGSSANLSGRGFAGMTFSAKSSSQAEYEEWVKSIKKSGKSLTLDEYNKLAEPSEYHPVVSYRLKEEGLFDWVAMKPMMENGK